MLRLLIAKSVLGHLSNGELIESFAFCFFTIFLKLGKILKIKTNNSDGMVVMSPKTKPVSLNDPILGILRNQEYRGK